MSYDLCEELIVEIFMRLPSKSLLRFRSVSKSLFACISSPRFIRLHALHSQKSVMLIHEAYRIGEVRSNYIYTLHWERQLSCDPYIGVTAVEYPFKDLGIFGSCNGILCVHEYGKSIHLWNPAIRRKVIICDRPSWIDPKSIRSVLGFGFDPIIGDYKVLMRADCKTEKGVVPSTFVYIMKTDTWHEIAYPTQFAYTWSCQCLLNGALHWVIKRNLTQSGDKICVYMLSFDLSSEVFSMIELPKPRWEINQVAIINGSLAVISLKNDYCRIWLRNNTTASWSVANKLKTHEFRAAQRVFQRTADDDLVFNPFLSGVTYHNAETRAQSAFLGLSGFCRAALTIPCVDSLELLDIGTPCD